MALLLHIFRFVSMQKTAVVYADTRIGTAVAADLPACGTAAESGGTISKKIKK